MLTRNVRQRRGAPCLRQDPDRGDRIRRVAFHQAERHAIDRSDVGFAGGDHRDRLGMLARHDHFGEETAVAGQRRDFTAQHVHTRLRRQTVDGAARPAKILQRIGRVVLVHHDETAVAAALAAGCPVDRRQQQRQIVGICCGQRVTAGLRQQQVRRAPKLGDRQPPRQGLGRVLHAFFRQRLGESRRPGVGCSGNERQVVHRQRDLHRGTTRVGAPAGIILPPRSTVNARALLRRSGPARRVRKTTDKHRKT